MSTLSQFALACKSIMLKDVLAVMFENDNEHDFNLVIDLHTKLNDLGMRIRQRSELILDVEKQDYLAEVFESMKLLKDLQETDNAKARCGYLNLSKAAVFGGIGTPKSYHGDWLGRGSNCLKDFIIVYYLARCDTTSVEEIRLKDGVITKLNSRVLGRERKGLSLDKSCVAEDFNNFSSGCWEELDEELTELCQTKFCVNKPAMIYLESDDDLVKDLSRYNQSTDRVHLTDAFDIFLGRQGPLRCRFPWCKDHVGLWVNYMWHVRPHDADWAMVGGYFVQLLLQDSIPSWYADNTLYKVSRCDVEEVFMPINETDQHWCLAHLHIRTRLVTFYDSGLTYYPKWRECSIGNNEQTTCVGIKRLLDDLGVTAANVCVTAAK
ncbi:phospholipase-like protein [Tanacetum coccineum]